MNVTNSLMDQALALHRQGRNADAEILYNRILEIDPAHGDARHLLGVIAFQAENYERAVSLIVEAIRVEPNVAPYYFNLAVVYEAIGQLQDAADCYQRGMAIDPDNLPIRGHLVALCIQLGQPDTALQLVRHGLSASPAWAEGRRMMGDLLLFKSQNSEAVTHYREAVRLEPGDAKAWNNLGNTLLRMRHMADAEASLRRAVALKPDYALAWANLGSIALNQFRHDEAVHCFERASQLDSTLTQLKANLDRAVRARDTELAVRRTIEKAPGISMEWLAKTSRLLQQTSTFTYVVEVVDTCNLRCPTCPRGNMRDTGRPRGLMKLDLFRQIVDKIALESPLPEPALWFYNWGEPLLHPDLPEMIRYARENGLYCAISSNLNVKRGLREMLEARPHEVKVSLSGFTQNTYGSGHVRGHIEKVKANLRELRGLENELATGARIWVSYHLYRDNLQELESMRQFSQDLAFEFMTIPSLYQPLEKMVELLEGTLPDHDRYFVETKIPYDPIKLLEIKRRYFHPQGDCEARYNMMSIARDGSVDLCCGIFKPENKLGLDFLRTPHEELQAAKYSHPFCGSCFSHAIALEPMPADAEFGMRAYQQEEIAKLKNTSL